MGVLFSQPQMDDTSNDRNASNASNASNNTLTFNHVPKDDIQYKEQEPKFKIGDPVHVVYDGYSYRSVNISEIIIEKGPNDTIKIKYNYSYNFGLSEGYAYQENLHLRDRYDYRTRILKIEKTEIARHLNKDLMIKIINTDICAICLQYEDEDGDTIKYALWCGNGKHCFHYACINIASKKKPLCPLCRTEISDDIFSILYKERVINAFYDTNCFQF